LIIKIPYGISLPEEESETKDGPILVNLADVRAEKVDWLWYGRIPRGKLTILVGDPGTGKSLLTIDMAARISTGGVWPDGTPVIKGKVIILSAEDDPADTIVPRLDLHGADRNFIHCFKGVRRGGKEFFFSLKSHLDSLKSAIIQTGAILVVIDPISAYMGFTNTFRDSDVRSILGPLSELAACTGVAVVAVMHLNKDSKNHVMYRTQGSIAFVAQARCVLALAKDPEDETRRVLASIKNNLALAPPAIGFRVTSEGKVTWEQEPIHNFDLNGAFGYPDAGEDTSKVAIAEVFLKEFLSDGPVPAHSVYSIGLENGFFKSTIRRAKKKIGIITKKEGCFGDQGYWTWELPERS